MPDYIPKRGFVDWNPRAEARELLAEINAVLDEYRDQLPLTIRQVYYRLVASGRYPKTEKFYFKVQQLTVDARRASLIPFDHLRDDGVTAVEAQYFDSCDDILRSMVAEVESYSPDPQRGQPKRIVLWCEASGMVAMLSRVARRYGVPVRSSSGFDSLTAKYNAGRELAQDSRPTVILHVGDYDPSGLSVYKSLQEDTVAFAQHFNPDADITVERVAITPEQVLRYDLPTSPKKITDNRGVWVGLGDDPTATAQAEALPPDLLLAIVETAIRQHYDGAIYVKLLREADADRTEALDRLRAAGLL